MTLGKILHVSNRRQWRAWLAKHHSSSPEIWLVYYKKSSGKKRIPYNNAVEEALCFGWIDSTVKTIDGERYAQRFSPRKKPSRWSEMNKERFRRLVKLEKMTVAGFAAFDEGKPGAGGPSKRGAAADKFVIPADIRRALKRDKKVWKNFQRFSDSYQRIRIGWIAAARHRPDVLRQRLRYFLRMTAQNRKFGMVQ